jgi:hypothetical protein
MSPAVNPARAAIRDERRNFYAVTGLLTLQRTVPTPETSALDREAAALAAERRVVVDERIGLFAYVAGPRLHIVDPDGRTDSFLARQAPSGEWKPGPRSRDVRPDYVAAVERRVSACSSCGSETAGEDVKPADASTAIRARNR